jgi:hypothetical protein
MSRRAASFSQADVARTIRAAKQEGATAVEVVQRNGTTIRVLLESPPLAPESLDPFDQWKRENEARKATKVRN